jgi:hypothetical protein
MCIRLRELNMIYMNYMAGTRMRNEKHFSSAFFGYKCFRLLSKVQKSRSSFQLIRRILFETSSSTL